MPSSLLSSGSSQASTADITVVAGTPKTVHGYGTAPWRLDLQIKNSAGTYTTVAVLNDITPSLTIYGPGVYRVHRAGGNTVGVNQD